MRLVWIFSVFVLTTFAYSDLRAQSLDGKALVEALQVDSTGLLAQVAVAQLLNVQSQIPLAETFDMQEEVARLKAEAEALSSDTALTPKKLRASLTKSRRINVSINARLEAVTELNDSRRGKLVSGALLYVGALHTTRNLAPKFQQTLMHGKQVLSQLKENPFRNALHIAEAGRLVMSLTRAATATTRLVASEVETVGMFLKTFDRIGIPVPQQIADFNLGAPPQQECAKKAAQQCLWVSVYPKQARIVLPDIVPRYHDGIALEARKHRVIVKAAGYASQTVWVDLSHSNQTIAVMLRPLS